MMRYACTLLGQAGPKHPTQPQPYSLRTHIISEVEQRPGKELEFYAQLLLTGESILFDLHNNPLVTMQSFSFADVCSL